MIFRWKGFSKRMKFAQDLLFCCNTILCQMAATAFLFPMFRTVLMSEWGTFWRVWKKQISSLWKYLSNAASFVLIGYVRAEFWILSEFLLCLNLNFWIVKQTNICGLWRPKRPLYHFKIKLSPEIAIEFYNLSPSFQVQSTQNFVWG